MSSKHNITAPFTILVGNLSGERDSKGNLIPTRQGFRQQLVIGGRSNLVAKTSDTAPSPSTGTVTVSNNTFSADAILFLGEYELVNGVDYTVGGTAGDTATNLAAAISNLSGYTASASGSDVDIEGPNGPFGGKIILDVEYEGTVQNFSLSPDDGFLAVGEPQLDSPEIL